MDGRKTTEEEMREIDIYAYCEGSFFCNNSNKEKKCVVSKSNNK